MGEFSSVSFEQNPVEDTLAALHVHSQSCAIKCAVNLKMNSVVFSENEGLLCCSAVCW